MPAPVVLFAYKRPAELAATLRALRANHLAPDSDLYVFVDGVKRPDDAPKVAQVRQLIDDFAGFRSIHRHYAERNIGCADSIIRGVSAVLERHGAAIVVEDDIITSPNFLDWMNAALTHYGGHRRVFSVSGYTLPFPRPTGYESDAYFVPRHSPWGWATWADRWQSVDWAMSDYPQFVRDRAQQRAFMAGGSDLPKMLADQMEGRADAWDIRFCYNRFKQGGLSVYPTVSKVQNIGFGKDATHTDIFNRYKTVMDDGAQRRFIFPECIETTAHYHQHTLRHYSAPVRIVNRLKTLAGLR